MMDVTELSIGAYDARDTLDILFDEQSGLLSPEMLQKIPLSSSAYCDMPDLSFVRSTFVLLVIYQLMDFLYKLFWK